MKIDVNYDKDKIQGFIKICEDVINGKSVISQWENNPQVIADAKIAIGIYKSYMDEQDLLWNKSNSNI